MDEVKYVLPPEMKWDVTPSSAEDSRRMNAEMVQWHREHQPEDLAVITTQAAIFEAADAALAGRSPREVRDAAVVVMRCDDCRGRAVGWLSWTSGRLLFMGNKDSAGKWAVVALVEEEGWAAPDFACRRVTFRLGYDVPLVDIPGPGGVPVIWRLRHADAKRCAKVPRTT